MSQDTSIQMVEKLVLPLLKDDVFLVSIKIKPTNNIKIYLDADNGLAIEKCAKINRDLYKIIEETGIYPDGNFSIEVSSPGIEEPLKLLRQYKKNIGREVEIITTNGVTLKGKLISITDDKITIEQTEGKGKKMITKNMELSLAAIKQTKVLIKF